MNQRMLAQCPIRQHIIVLTSQCLDAVDLFSVFLGEHMRKIFWEIERQTFFFSFLYFTIY